MKLSTNADDINYLNRLIHDNNLGPTTAVGRLAYSDMVVIELDGTVAHRTELLARWLRVLTVRSMAAGKTNAADPLLRLHLRGPLPNWPSACVTMPFREIEDAAHCATIRTHIGDLTPTELIHELSSLDGG